MLCPWEAEILLEEELNKPPNALTAYVTMLHLEGSIRREGSDKSISIADVESPCVVCIEFHDLETVFDGQFHVFRLHSC